MKKQELEGRYLKVVGSVNFEDIYYFKKGDYLEFKEIEGDLEWWGIYSKDHNENKIKKIPYYFGTNAHKTNYFELMPVGFKPYWEEIQTEAKKRYPIGCTYKYSDDNEFYKLELDSTTYKIAPPYIFAHDWGGWLYFDGKWAEKYEEPTKVNDDWCVEVTLENREIIKNWVNDSTFNCSIGAFYGYKQGEIDGSTQSWGLVISTEEFCNKIGDFSKYYFSGSGYDPYENKQSSPKHDPLSYLKEQGHIFIDAETTGVIKVQKSASITLKNVENEVKIKIKQPKTVKL